MQELPMVTRGGGALLLRSTRGGGALLSRLGEQMLSLAQVADPSAAEKRRRARARDRVTSAVRRVYAEGDVMVFGSSATGLTLPGSDLDLALALPGADGRAPSALLSPVVRCVRSVAEDRRAHFIAHARVPIITFVEADSGLSVDLSAVDNGVSNSQGIRETLASHAELRPLLLVLKVFLRQHGLNKTQSGGVGSYLLFAMAQRVVQRPPKARVRRGSSDDGPPAASLVDAAAEPPPQAASRPSEAELLGQLLLDFLWAYSRPGLSVPDPFAASGLRVDLGRAASRFPFISHIFRQRLQRLTERECLSDFIDGWPEGGLLKTDAQLARLLAGAPPSAMQSRPSKSPRRRAPTQTEPTEWIAKQEKKAAKQQRASLRRQEKLEKRAARAATQLVRAREKMRDYNSTRAVRRRQRKE